ncbi:hypothetical protein [Edwardsiella ictaluri]
MAGTAFQCYLLASRASAIQLCGLLTVTVLGFLYVSWRYPRIANSIEESHESE